MHCNLFCSSQTIKFCMTLDRLLHRHRYTNSIQKLSLSHWVMHGGNLSKFTCCWIIKLLDQEEECLFLYSSPNIFSSLSSLSLSSNSIYLAFCCLLLHSRHICTFTFISTSSPHKLRLCCRYQRALLSSCQWAVSHRLSPHFSHSHRY